MRTRVGGGPWSRRVAALALAGVLLAGLPGRAQQQAAAPPGRFLPGGTRDGYLLCLDSWTGRLHAAPAGDEPGGQGWVVDLPQARLAGRALARDVSAGRPLPHPEVLSGDGARASVFLWDGAAGVLDTRSGVHYALAGALGPEARVVRTDLRLLTRSIRPLQGGGPDPIPGGDRRD